MSSTETLHPLISSIDVNCDLGEGFGNWAMAPDAELMRLITSANIACGFHAGDPMIMAATVELALEHGVAIGAHPGFADPIGFGRRQILLSPDEVAASITYQIGALTGFLTARGATLNHVKPHGAFYSYLRDYDSVGAAAAHAVHRVAPEAKIYWPAPAETVVFCETLLDLGHVVVGDIYPDLTYSANGNIIVQRRKLHTDPAFITSQVRRFVLDGQLEAEDGSLVTHRAGSICIHSDGPNALEVARTVRSTLDALGVAASAAKSN